MSSLRSPTPFLHLVVGELFTENITPEFGVGWGGLAGLAALAPPLT